MLLVLSTTTSTADKLNSSAEFFELINNIQSINIIVILLTNRVHPNRDNPMRMYEVRRKFHNTLIKKIGG